MLLDALLFAYTQGIFSGRKIEKMMAESIPMPYVTGQFILSYRTINRFRFSQNIDKLISDLFIELNLRLKMEELISMECLYIDGTKIEAKANKYSFVWKKATEKFSARLQDNLRSYFQEEIKPLIQEAIMLDEQETITSELLAKFSQLLEEELKTVEQDMGKILLKAKIPAKPNVETSKKFFVK